ncbi:MAG: helix-turn-helix domain-containing protein [Verrucomicrobiaceae bacterium]|nr:helix-turn-helix domain-containing protein [Verrucomicrobiaceae bacterium]
MLTHSIVMEHDTSNLTSAAEALCTKVTRHELAQRLRLSLRYVDELTRSGVLPYFKIGRSVRYDLAECEAVFRERFYVRAKARRA